MVLVCICVCVCVFDHICMCHMQDYIFKLPIWTWTMKWTITHEDLFLLLNINKLFGNLIVLFCPTKKNESNLWGVIPQPRVTYVLSFQQQQKRNQNREVERERECVGDEIIQNIVVFFRLWNSKKYCYY